MENYLDKLSDVQKEAVCYSTGPSLVVAGAGSGKTRVLTCKIAHLVDEGYKPSSILALTFTNKAAKEMKTRIATMVGEENARRLWMGTFHSIFSRILRTEAEAIGFTHDFTIYDSSDTLNLIKAIIKEKKLDDKVYAPKKIANRISQMKNDLISSDNYSKSQLAIYHDWDMKNRIPLFGELYKHYTIRCKRANAMDFDDLLLYTNILFRDRGDLLVKYQNIFKFILVDEYQDTNFAQFMIVQKLASKSHKVCVVGDDAQSIYSFRGARIDNILDFKNKYPECKIFKLEQNYRSSQSIVNVANSLIKKNEKQIPKNVFSKNAVGAPVKVLSSPTQEEEGKNITALIEQMHANKEGNYSDFAILYRTNAQSLVFEKILRINNIPYKIYGSTSFYDHAEIKDILAYARIVINTHDDEALKRTLKQRPGIGDTTVNKIFEQAQNNNLCGWDILSNPITFGVKVTSNTANKLNDYKLLIDKFISKKEEIDAYELLQVIVHDSGIWTVLHQDMSPEGKTRQQNVDELLNELSLSCAHRIEQTGDKYMLNEFMSEVALMTSQDEHESNNDKVTLMTVHAAKGLEFKNVFVAGVEEELFPSNMSTGTIEGIEEERRLFYVAITRAESQCFISYSISRFKNGSFNNTNPSRFIKDIDPNLLDFSGAKNYSTTFNRLNSSFPNFGERPNNGYHFEIKKKDPPKYNFSNITRTSQKNIANIASEKKNIVSVNNINTSKLSSKLFSFNINDLKVGSIVEHEQFGIGIVESIIGLGTLIAKANINFKNSGKKTLMLKYAKLKIIK